MSFPTTYHYWVYPLIQHPLWNLSSGLRGTRAFRATIALLIAFAMCWMLSSPAVAQMGGRGMGGTRGMGGGPGGAGMPKPEPKRERTRLPNFAPATTIPIQQIRIVGNKRMPTERIAAMLHTREGRFYDPETVQRDVRTLIASGMFQDVKTYKRDVTGGKSITFEVVERPTIAYVRYVGNEDVSDRKLDKDIGLKPGDPLNGFAVEEARRRLQKIYRDKGYADAHIEVIEGTKPGHQGVAFQIHEGGLQRIYKVNFIGNTIATDARLKTTIKSKPGILWLFGGKVQRDQIDQDVDRLTAYYRSLGYFRARVGRKIEYNEDHDWMTLTFVIDEGARYRIRQIRTDGNEAVPLQSMVGEMESRPGDFYNFATIQRDLNAVRDHYGGAGYIFADIRAEPQFQEEPGEIDIVYKIDEGKQYRIGRILVNIDGENPHTRRSVVLNRLSMRPGDVIDIRKLRTSERRLQASQLFLHDPAAGITPKIVVRPPVQDESQIAVADDPTVRGQSAHVSYRPAVVDVYVSGKLKPEVQRELVQPRNQLRIPNPAQGANPLRNASRSSTGSGTRR